MRQTSNCWFTAKEGCKHGHYGRQNDSCLSRLDERREVMHEKSLDFVATLIPRPDRVKILHERFESVWVERCHEVDANGMPST